MLLVTQGLRQNIESYDGCAVIKMIIDVEVNHSLFCVFLSAAEEEYKRLSEALADEGTYNAVAFKYSADYYDPSQPTEEEDANRETGENPRTLTYLRSLTVSLSHSY